MRETMTLELSNWERHLLTDGLLDSARSTIDAIRGIRERNGDGNRPSEETVSTVRNWKRLATDKLRLARRVSPDSALFLIDNRCEDLTIACHEALEDTKRADQQFLQLLNRTFD